MTTRATPKPLSDGPQPAEGVLERPVPAPEEQHGEQQRQHDDPRVLGEEEQREPQAAVLGVGARRRARRRRPACRTAAAAARRGRRRGRPRPPGSLPQQPPGLPGLGDARSGRASRRPARRTPPARRSAARRTRAGRRRGSRRAGSTCSRWTSRPSGCRARRPPVAASTKTSRPGTSTAATPGSRPGRPRGRRGRAPARPRGRAGRPTGRRRRGDVLLLDELHPVGDELRPAVEATGVHRPETALHVRHHLVLDLPHEQGQDEEGGERGDGPQRRLEEGHRGPHSGGGTPAAWTRRRLGERADS